MTTYFFTHTHTLRSRAEAVVTDAMDLESFLQTLEDKKQTIAATITERENVNSDSLNLLNQVSCGICQFSYSITCTYHKFYFGQKTNAHAIGTKIFHLCLSLIHIHKLQQ